MRMRFSVGEIVRNDSRIYLLVDWWTRWWLNFCPHLVHRPMPTLSPSAGHLMEVESSCVEISMAMCLHFQLNHCLRWWKRSDTMWNSTIEVCDSCSTVSIEQLWMPNNIIAMAFCRVNKLLLFRTNLWDSSWIFGPNFVFDVNLTFGEKDRQIAKNEGVQWCTKENEVTDFMWTTLRIQIMCGSCTTQRNSNAKSCLSHVLDIYDLISWWMRINRSIHCQPHSCPPIYNLTFLTITAHYSYIHIELLQRHRPWPLVCVSPLSTAIGTLDNYLWTHGAVPKHVRHCVCVCVWPKSNE